MKVLAYYTNKTLDERKNLNARLAAYLLAKCPRIDVFRTARRAGKVRASLYMSDAMHDALKRASKHYHKSMSVIINAALVSSRPHDS